MVVRQEPVSQAYLATPAMVVDIYCRVSRDEQEDNTSLDEQETACRIYCRDHGLIVGMVHRETFTGYKYRERKKLTLVRECYHDGKIQGVVVRTLDRLSRQQTHVAILMEEMEHYDVTLYSAKEIIDDTPMGKFARMVLAFVAEMEREKIMDRTFSGRISKAQDGKVPVGQVPYGRKWVYNDNGEHDHIELVEKEAAVLRWAAQAYADGISSSSIVAKLNADGVPSATGGIWYNGSLLRLLTDPRITGQNLQAFDSKWSTAKHRLGAVALPDDTYPQIITPELYERVLARTASNTAASPRRSAERRCFYCVAVTPAVSTAATPWAGSSPGVRDGRTSTCTAVAPKPLTATSTRSMLWRSMPKFGTWQAWPLTTNN